MGKGAGPAFERGDRSRDPVPVPALKGTNIDKLVDEISPACRKARPFYSSDVLTDFRGSWTIQDVIR
jgi:GTPase Era involved in 16S rRNA processing